MSIPALVARMPQRRRLDVVRPWNALCFVQATASEVGWRTAVSIIRIQHAVEIAPGEPSQLPNTSERLPRRLAPVCEELLHLR